MEIDLLREFIILSQCLNYSKAAGQLFISQSVLSRHIQNLESQLGVALLSRDKHSVELTPIGAVFAEDAKKVVEQYSRAMKHVQMSREGVLGELDIISSRTLSAYFMYDFMIEFTKKYPHIKANVNIKENGLSTAHDILERRSDMAIIVDWPDIRALPLSRRTFFKDHLYIVVSDSHPLAGRESVYIDELSGIPMIYFNQKENLCAAAYFEKLFADHGAVYNPSIITEGLETLFFKIISSQGISIISEHVYKLIPPNIRAIRIADADAYIDVDLIWSPDNDNGSLPVFLNEFDKFTEKYNKNHHI